MIPGEHTRVSLVWMWMKISAIRTGRPFDEGFDRKAESEAERLILTCKEHLIGFMNSWILQHGRVEIGPWRSRVVRYDIGV